ncbi:MAG: 4-hydroxy-tetrahydrodipicolinate reductase [Kiritimatiellae bacterium]|nr:4-hydroxy-tetrahydrodipicolinate reductase [Kiritimatiellia bacterium]
MISVTILGASGRMGGALVRAARNFSNDIKLAAVVDRAGLPCIGMDSGTIAGIQPNGILITDDLDAAVQACDVVIDFTFHTAVLTTAPVVAKYKKGYVLGTTSLTAKEEALVAEVVKVAPVVRSPNMSLGVNLLFSLVKQAAALLNEGYDAEIIEIHHKHKKDAPSGTALGLAKALAEGRNVNLDDVVCYGREGVSDEERDPKTIAIHAVRGGDVVGDHTVIFAADGERVELTHKASSRESFAGGALKAAIWMANKEPGVYTMKDVLNIK